MTAAPRPQPSTAMEEALWASGSRYVAGVDEVGRGPLAGPVYACAVILDCNRRKPWWEELRDSKVLKAADRERLSLLVQEQALAFGVGWSTVAEINEIGIGPANKQAMVRAMEAMRIVPHFVLIDGPLTVDHPLPQRAVVDGDATCTSIAAASIVAKVARDALMCDLDVLHPQYGFAEHKGYATKMHLESIERYGLCEHHRSGWIAVQRRAGLLPMLDLEFETAAS